MHLNRQVKGQRMLQKVKNVHVLVEVERCQECIHANKGVNAESVW